MNEQPTYFGILIGTKNALKIDLARVRDRMSNTAVKEDLSLIGIEHPLQIPSFLLLDEEGMRRYAAGSRLHTDDDPVLEHHSMLSYYFYLPYFTENLRDTLAFRPAAAAPFIVSHDKSEADEAEHVWRASALRYQALLHQSEIAIEKDGSAQLTSAVAAREAASQALRVHPGWTSSRRWFKVIEQIVIHIKLN